MGKVKYTSNAREFFKKSSVVSIGSLKGFLKNKKYVYLLINNMLKKGEIKKITRGYYTMYDDPSLAVFCFKPSYIGLQDALALHGLWEQETTPIIITTKKVRQGTRNILDNNVIIKRISKKYFFGIEHKEYNNSYLPVSDIEKTLIDFVYFNEPLDKETIKNFKKRVDEKRLRKYLGVYQKRIRTVVLRTLG